MKMLTFLIVTALIVNDGLVAFHLPTRGPIVVVNPPGSDKSIATFGLGTRFPQYKKNVQELKTLIAQFFNIKLQGDRKDLLVPFDDMILTEAQVLRLLDVFKKLLQSGRRRSKRKIVDFTVDKTKWDVSKPIQYIIEKQFGKEDSQIINEAIKHWEENTCIRFEQVQKQTELKENHIEFTYTSSQCSSSVGMVNGGTNFISLGKRCVPLKGVAIHEIGHAMGLVHEQMRLDRDDFVKIDLDNIKSYANTINFLKYFQVGLTTLRVPYDVGSIMHYSSFAFAKEDKKRTIITKDKFLQLNLGQRIGLSFYDIKIVNLAYCKGKCKNQRKCQRGGITDPNNCNKCICPDGFGGNDCETVGSVHNGCTPRQIITVTSGEQCIKSPNYGGTGTYNPFTECNWHLKAPVGKTIEMYFKGTFSLFMYEAKSCYHWVEVKYKRNLELPGARFCGTSPSKDRLLSFGNLAVVSFRSNFQDKPPIPADKRKGFQLCFKLAGTKRTGSPKPRRTTKAPKECKNKLKLNCKNFNKPTEWDIFTDPDHRDMGKAIFQCDGKLEKVNRNLQFNITATPGSRNPPRVLSVCVRRSGVKRTTISLKVPGRGTGRHFKLSPRQYCKVMSIEAESIAIELEKKSKTMSIWDLTVEVCKG